jgi:hypothetical protein
MFVIYGAINMDRTIIYTLPLLLLRRDLIHSNIDYCNFLLLSLNSCFSNQINRLTLKFVFNSAARGRVPARHPITPKLHHSIYSKISPYAYNKSENSIQSLSRSLSPVIAAP